MTVEKMKTVADWERENGLPFPLWAAIWSYDAYSECWKSCLWKERKEFYEQERLQPPRRDPWDFHYEPIVCLPTDDPPKWGDARCTPLRRIP